MDVGLQVMELNKEAKGACLLGKDLVQHLFFGCLDLHHQWDAQCLVPHHCCSCFVLCHRQGFTLLSPKHLKWFKTRSQPSLSFSQKQGRRDFSYVDVEPLDASRKCHLPLQCLKVSLTPAWEPQCRGDAKVRDISKDQLICNFALQSGKCKCKMATRSSDLIPAI